jgi:hypothetical protein
MGTKEACSTMASTLSEVSSDRVVCALQVPPAVVHADRQDSPTLASSQEGVTVCVIASCGSCTMIAHTDQASRQRNIVDEHRGAERFVTGIKQAGVAAMLQQDTRKMVLVAAFLGESHIPFLATNSFLARWYLVAFG